MKNKHRISESSDTFNVYLEFVSPIIAAHAILPRHRWHRHRKNKHKQSTFTSAKLFLRWKITDVWQSFREIRSSEASRKSLGIAKKPDTVKAEPWFNFFQVQTVVYRYIGKPFHHYILPYMATILWQVRQYIVSIKVC